MATEISTGQKPVMTHSPLTRAREAQTEVTFPVTGMTCASCVRRIERRLGKVDGVQDVNVNLATEKARVVFDPGLVGLPDLVAAVEKAGYGVGELPTRSPPRLPTPAHAQTAPLIRPREGTPGAVGAASQLRLRSPCGESPPSRPHLAGEGAAARGIDDLKRKSLVSLAIGLVMMALMYLPLDLDMQLLAPVLLIAATVVQVWAGRDFYRAAWAAAQHGSTNMNTLVAVGTSVAFGYSAFVTLWPTPRRSAGASRTTSTTRRRSSSSR